MHKSYINIKYVFSSTSWFPVCCAFTSLPHLVIVGCRNKQRFRCWVAVWSCIHAVNLHLQIATRSSCKACSTLWSCQTKAFLELWISEFLTRISRVTRLETQMKSLLARLGLIAMIRTPEQRTVKDANLSQCSDVSKGSVCLPAVNRECLEPLEVH